MAIDQDLKTGFVVIGRNEGERLRACFESIPTSFPVVYVDSASTDGSVELAKTFRFEVVELTADEPLSAGRGRNAGLDHLIKTWPALTYVQFLDGDCELFPEWIAIGEKALENDPKLVAVCGQRHEKYPDQTVYNQLCAIEWNTPIGEASAVGGDSLMRIDPIIQVGRFDPTFVGGEEPELCYRLRQVGWKIARLDAPMTLHDAAMTNWIQWWSRNVRSGGAYAQSAKKHGRGPEKFGVRESISIWLYAAVLPLIAILFGPLTGWSSLLALLIIYLVQWVRISQNAAQNRGLSKPLARQYAASVVLGKFPHWAGQLRFFLFGRTNVVEKREIA